jgi:comEA protein
MKNSGIRTLIFLCLIILGSAVLFSTLKEIADTPEIKSVEPVSFAQSDNSLVNINTADSSELESLYGIGKKRADDIIELRTVHGRFVTTEDLMRVDGISRKIFERIKDYITV